MAFRVLTLGGQMAPEGRDILTSAGVDLLETDVYPSPDVSRDVIAAHRPDAIVVRLVEFLDAGSLKAAPSVRLVAKHGAGTNDIDVAGALAAGIPVIMATGANAQSVAEHALTLMLALSKDVIIQDARIRAGVWDKKDYRGRELRGRSLSLVGLGLIGQALVPMARALGMTVSAYDPFARDELFGDQLLRAGSLDSLLETSDIVSLHCPLTPQTRGLIGARELGLMKRDALLINTARGEVVDEDALIAALAAGRIAGAGLDSFAQEPPAESELWRMPNVILSPHVAGVTEDARREVSRMTARNVLRFLNGEQLERHLFARA